MAHLARTFQLALLLSLVGSNAHAEPSARAPAVPPQLEPWVPWVLDGVGDARCPEVEGVRVCAWPSALSLDVGARSASFTLRVTRDRPGSIVLPGSREHWPEEVQLDGKPAPVLEPTGQPALEVGAGAHTVTGRFAFKQAPAALSIPANVGALALRRDGRVIARPKREESGLLWLEESTGDGQAEERLSLSVHRRIEDAVPLRVITRIEITASGAAREIVLDEVPLLGTRPIELRADLPAQLETSGSLRLQAQGGRYRVELVALAETPPRELRAPKRPEPWPSQEVWVFAADDRLRHVELQGAPQIDPARTDLEPDWRGLPTFVLASGTTLRFETRRRGEQEPAPNRLALERALWLDVDGDGYTVRDELRGTMHQGFRLDLEPSTLGHALVGGTDELITKRGGHAGVELRTGTVTLTTEWRLEHGRRELPAVGYSEDVESLSATLHLPPGFTLLGARGVDAIQGTWLDAWNLFDFFFVLLMVLAVAKLAGWPYGVVTLLALTLSQHEPSAPGATWVALLALTALTRALRAGRWAKLARGAWIAALIVLLLELLPFAIVQVRAALYPQLAPTQTSSWSFARNEAPAPEGMAQQALEAADLLGVQGTPSEEAPERKRADFAGGAARPSAPTAAKSAAYSSRELLDPSAIVQTGPGIPTWRFRSYALRWSGPVARHERIQLWMLPPFATRLWALGCVLFAGLLLFGLARSARMRDDPSQPPSSPTPEEPPVEAAAALGVLLALLGPALAHAQDAPSPMLLDELQKRLLRAPECAPRCVSLPKLTLSLGEERLVAHAEVHAAEGGVYRAPGPLAQWPIDGLRIDGKDALAAARLDDGFLYVRVPAGIHQLELSGYVPDDHAWTLALGDPVPHRVETTGAGWVIEGLHADGSSEGSLELRRAVKRGGKQATEQALTPWLEVRRELTLGLRFRIRTTLTRLGPASESVLVRLPLLPGEAVNDANLASERDSVVVTLPRDARSLQFESTLAPRPRLDLRAAQPSEDGQLVRPYSELWVVLPAPLYHVRFEGSAPVSRLGEQDRYEPTYRPWPGETLTIHADRLEAAEGASVTIDQAELRFTPGTRIEQSMLTLQLRASRGTTERIALPPDAQLAALEVDQRAHPARLKQGVLELPLDPGAHVVRVTLKRPASFAFRYTPLRPKLSRPVANLLIGIDVPRDRWLLWLGGPAWGPAVLFWGYLALVLLVAVALGRVPHSPLRTHQWGLLGLGLTQIEPAGALLVVGWLFALAYRERHAIVSRRLFNLGQVLLVIFTAVALSCLAYAVQESLLVPPDMQVQGMMSSHNFVQWYADHSAGDLPEVSLWTAPLWIYKGVMLLWALWLAASLIHWLRWGWVAFRKGGAYRPKPPGARLSGAVRPTRSQDSPSAGRDPNADPERARVS